MGYKLCIAEKPSVAGDIAKVIGASQKENGYYSGNGYLVTWTVGHLVGLAEPHEYGYISQKQMYDKSHPEYKRKAFEELPLYPDVFKLVVLEKTKSQFNIIKKLMKRADVDIIIDCGDMGPEGHILQWFIREKANCTKPVKRFCATSMTEEAILKAMNNLVDVSKFENIIIGEYCKKKADWMLGMSLSRCANIKFNARIDVGRVQTPTLYFVVNRYLEVTNFKAQNYYHIDCLFENDFRMSFSKDFHGVLKSEFKNDNGQIIRKDVADQLSKVIMSTKSGVVNQLETKTKLSKPPKLYDITELQKDANNKFGFTADETLSIAQALYEKHKILTYPRTDSRFLTSDLKPFLEPLLMSIARYNEFKVQAQTVLAGGLLIDSRIIDDEKVTDHHAMIVTEKIKNFNLESLTENERKILLLVIQRMVVALSPVQTYSETTLSVKLSNGLLLHKSGKQILSKGWKGIEGSFGTEETESADDVKKDEHIPKHLKIGDSLQLKNVDVLTKKTSPPKLHTDASLLSYMKNAGNKIENGQILKGKGIGTQSTQGAIIKSLIDKKYAVYETKGKSKFLIPTQMGIKILQVLPQELYSPKITADWELEISKIANGESSPETFMSSFIHFLNKCITHIKNFDVSKVDFSYKIEPFGVCPFCKSDIIKTKDKSDSKNSFYLCTNKCGFFLSASNKKFLSNTGRKLVDSQVLKLMKGDKIRTKCKDENENVFYGTFELGKFVNNDNNDKSIAFLKFSKPKKRK